jgi:hypothetical protein
MDGQQNTLSDYVIQYLQLGYDLQSIRQSLLNSGYAIEQINAAIDYALAQSQSRSAKRAFSQAYSQTAQGQGFSRTQLIFGFKPLQLIILIFVLLIIAGFAIAFVQLTSDSWQNPTLNQPLNQQNQQQGGSSQNSLGSSNGTTQVRNSSQSQTGQGSQTTSTADLDAKYGLGGANSGGSTNFGSISNSGQSNTVQILQELYDDETQRRLTRIEIEEKVDALSLTNPDDASILCQQILTSAGKFTCLSKVAILSQTPKYCAMIDDLAAKDTCYMNFPIKELGDVKLCDFVQNSVKKTSCIELYAVLDIIAAQKNSSFSSNSNSNGVAIEPNTNIIPPALREYDEGITVFFD